MKKCCSLCCRNVTCNPTCGCDNCVDFPCSHADLRSYSIMVAAKTHGTPPPELTQALGEQMVTEHQSQLTCLLLPHQHARRTQFREFPSSFQQYISIFPVLFGASEAEETFQTMIKILLNHYVCRLLHLFCSSYACRENQASQGSGSGLHNLSIGLDWLLRTLEL